MPRITKDSWNEFRRHPNEQAFAPLYEQSRALVYTICYRILKNPDDAEDAFQATFNRIVVTVRDQQSAEELEIPEDFITRTAVREADSLRKRRARRSSREVVMEFLPENTTQQIATDEIVAQRELRARIETLVQTLPDRYRIPILLHFFDGMSHAEIARTLDQPARTISDRVARGLKKLKPLMQRAGLRESIATGTIIVVGQLINPPSAMAAETVFAKAATANLAVTAAASAGLLTRIAAWKLIAMLCAAALAVWGIIATFSSPPEILIVASNTSAQHNTIQSAIDAASNGDIIIIEPGVYFENIQFKGKNITLKSTNPDDPEVVKATIIDGVNSASVVSFTGGESKKCLLAGFTITNGNGIDGGGIDGRGTRATIRNNIIRNNIATNGGGVSGCNGMLQKNIITSNRCEENGGGIYQSAATLINNTIVENQATDGGGLSRCSGQIVNCILWGNRAKRDHQVQESLKLEHCCIEDWVGGDKGNTWENPMFANSRKNIFSLLPDSSCIDAGIKISGRANLQNSGAAPDIGAFEFDTSSKKYSHYFPSGLLDYRTPGFKSEVFLNVMNPDLNNEAQLHLTFYFEDRPPYTTNDSIPPRSRKTFNVVQLLLNRGISAAAFGIRVMSLNETPIYAERASYTSGPNISRTAGYSTNGSAELKQQWQLIRGTTKNQTNAWIDIINPNSKTLKLKIKFAADGAGIEEKKVECLPWRRVTVFAGSTIKDADYIATVSSENNLPFAVEQVMANHDQATEAQRWMANTSPHEQPADQWYFAETHNSNSAKTELILYNPGNTDIDIFVKLYYVKAPATETSILLPAAKRLAIPVSDLRSANSAIPEFSIELKATGEQQFYAEKTTHWISPQNIAAHRKSAVRGIPQPQKEWYFPEGAVGGGSQFECTHTIFNPGNKDARVRILYVQEQGFNIPLEFFVPAKSRRKINALDQLASGNGTQSFSAIIESLNGIEIVAERTSSWSHAAAKNVGTHSSSGIAAK